MVFIGVEAWVVGMGLKVVVVVVLGGWWWCTGGGYLNSGGFVGNDGVRLLVLEALRWRLCELGPVQWKWCFKGGGVEVELVVL